MKPHLTIHEAREAMLLRKTVVVCVPEVHGGFSIASWKPVKIESIEEFPSRMSTVTVGVDNYVRRSHPLSAIYKYDPPAAPLTPERAFDLLISTDPKQTNNILLPDSNVRATITSIRRCRSTLKEEEATTPYRHRYPDPSLFITLISEFDGPGSVREFHISDLRELK